MKAQRFTRRPMAALQKHAAPVTKITIVPRTSGALGYTMQVDEEEHVLMKREDILAKLAVLTAGRAAEEYACNTCTTYEYYREY